MSAVLQLPIVWAARAAQGTAAHETAQPQRIASAINHIRKPQPPAEFVEPVPQPEVPAEPVVSYAFYRKHTEKLLRRYLYASMQVNRSPNLLGGSVGRGWVSSRRVRTFEDALIFVLDVERCLKRLRPIDREMITRIVLQEYTQTEAAALLKISVRTVCTKFPQALDRLTESLVEADLLVLPD